MPKPALSTPTPPTKWKDMTPAQKKAARAANRGGSSTGGSTNYIDQLTPTIPDNINYIADQTKLINKKAGQIGNQAQNYAQNNRFANAAFDYNQDMLSGSMARNPWEQSAFNDAEGIRNPTNEALDALRGYLGGGPGSSGSGSGPSGGGSYNYSASMAANPSLWGGGTGQGGGIRDTIGNSSDWVAQQIRRVSDAATGDPLDAPGMRKYLESLRGEATENQNAMMQDLAMRSEGSGLFGTGSHDYLMNRAREEGMESLDQLIGGQLMGSREANLNRWMQAIGLGEQRDEANMQDQTNRYGIDASSASAGAGQAAALADAAEGRRLQALGMMLGTGSDLMGFKGNMASLRQGGQLAANQNGLGFANLGLQGYGTNLAAQQNQLASLGLLGDTMQGISNADLNRRQIDANARVGMAGVGVQRGQLQLDKQMALLNSQNGLMNLLSQLGNMGGGGTQTTPGTYVPYQNPTTAALGGALGGALGTYGTLWGGQQPIYPVSPPSSTPPGWTGGASGLGGAGIP